MSKYSNRYTDEDLLNEIRNVYNELGRVPNVSDFFKRTPNASTFRRFGSWKNALSLAGLKKEKVKSTDYTDEYLLNCMIEYYHKTNKIPTIRGMKKEGYPTAHAYINHFGSFKNALINADLFKLREDKHQFCDTYTDIRIKKYEYTDLLCEDYIKKGVFDIGCSILPSNLNDIDFIPIKSEKLYLIVNTKNPLSQKKKIIFKD
jgi:hypothetical protein